MSFRDCQPVVDFTVRKVDFYDISHSKVKFAFWTVIKVFRTNLVKKMLTRKSNSPFVFDVFFADSAPRDLFYFRLRKHFLFLFAKNKMEKVYYSPKGYWKGVSAIDKLAKEAGTSKKEAREFLKKQALWQIYLPAPKYVPRAKFSVSVPNEVHQADLLFLPHDRPGKGRKLYKYALTVVDIASRFKEAEPLSSKESSEVAKAFERIYSRTLKWPKTLQVDPGREFMGKVTEVMKKHNVTIRRGEAKHHRAQAIVERFNRTLAEKLFGYQYAQEILMEARSAASSGSNGKSVRSTSWVERLPDVIEALNNEDTRLIGMKPVDAIKKKEVKIQSSAPQKLRNEIQIPDNVRLRYLYQLGELGRWRKS